MMMMMMMKVTCRFENF